MSSDPVTKPEANPENTPPAQPAAPTQQTPQTHTQPAQPIQPTGAEAPKTESAGTQPSPELSTRPTVPHIPTPPDPATEAKPETASSTAPAATSTSPATPTPAAANAETKAETKPESTPSAASTPSAPSASSTSSAQPAASTPTPTAENKPDSPAAQPAPAASTSPAPTPPITTIEAKPEGAPPGTVPAAASMAPAQSAPPGASANGNHLGGPPAGAPMGGPPPQIFTEEPINEKVKPDLSNLYLFGQPQFDRDRLIAQSYIFGQFIRFNAAKFVGQNITSILDMGCGDGQLTLIFRKIYPKARVVGVDMDPRAIETARKLKERTPDLPQPIEYMVYNVEESLPDGPFDLIYASMLMMHLPNPRKALENAVSKLAPGGFLWVKDLDPNMAENVDNPIFKWFYNMLNETSIKIGKNPFIGRELEQIFTELGLEEVKYKPEEYKIGEKGPAAMQSQIVLSTGLGAFFNARMALSKFNNIPMEEILAKHQELSKQANTLRGITRWPNVIGRKPKRDTGALKL